jgi:hypothetical protein
VDRVAILSDKGKILSDKPEILSVEKYPSK